jgi:hypothetical protein
VKFFRIYYHDSSNRPRVWSVDEGTLATEVHVKAIVVKGCTMTSMVDFDHVPGGPAGFFAVFASRYELRDSTAIFSAG